MRCFATCYRSKQCAVIEQTSHSDRTDNSLQQQQQQQQQQWIQLQQLFYYCFWWLQCLATSVPTPRAHNHYVTITSLDLQTTCSYWTARRASVRTSSVEWRASFSGSFTTSSRYATNTTASRWCSTTLTSQCQSISYQTTTRCRSVSYFVAVDCGKARCALIAPRRPAREGSCLQVSNVPYRH